MFLVQRFLTAFTVIDADGAFKTFYFEIAEGLSPEIVKRSVGCDIFAAYRTTFLALQMEGGGWSVDAVEVPMGSRHVDA